MSHKPESFRDLLKFLTYLSLVKNEMDAESVRLKALSWFKGSADFLNALDEYGGISITKGNVSTLKQLMSDIYNDELTPDSDGLVYIRNWLENNRKLDVLSIKTSKMIGTDAELSYLDYNRKALSGKSLDSIKNIALRVTAVTKDSSLSRCFSSVKISSTKASEKLPEKYKDKSPEDLVKITFNIAKKLYDTGLSTVLPPKVNNHAKLKDSKYANDLETWKVLDTFLRNHGKEELSSFIRQNYTEEIDGVPVVPLKSVQAFLKSRKDIPVHGVCMLLNRGEYIDDVGTLYTKDKHKLSGGIGQYSTDIQYNKNYVPPADGNTNNTRYLAYKNPNNEAVVGLYAIGNKLSSRANKFEIVQTVLDNIDEIRAKWCADLNKKTLGNKGLSETAIIATVVEIIYQTAIRVGSRDGSGKTQTADGEVETYGVLQFQKEHVVKCTPTLIELKFKGKAAQDQSYVIKRDDVDSNFAKAFDNFKLLIDGAKKPTDKVLPDKLYSKVNPYLKAVTGIEGMSVHKFRHMKATQMAQEFLNSKEAKKYLSQPNLTSAELYSWLQDNLSSIGQQLGHFNKGAVTIKTAITSYIDTTFLISIFNKCKVKVPKELDKLTTI